MTTTQASTITWYDDLEVAGTPYPTRHHTPDTEGDSDACFNLPPQQLDYLRAIHEAGHAVAALVGRGHLHHAQIVKGTATSTEGGVTHSCNLADGHAFAVLSAAGERASDRWLREAGLWTPERAVAVEVGAHGDRHLFLSSNPHVGFGDKQVDYCVVHDLADQMLDEHWAAVIRVTDALAHRAYLTGDQIADLAQMPNGTHTCTGTPTA